MSRQGETTLELDLEIDQDRRVARLTLDGPCHVADIAGVFDRLVELNARPDLVVMTEVGDARMSGASFAAMMEADDAFDRFSRAYPVGTHVLMLRGRSIKGIPSMLARLAREKGYGLRIFRERDGVLSELDDDGA